MSTPQVKPGEIWKRRWDALKATLDALEALFSDSGSAITRQKTLKVLIEGLRNVGEKHFDYFYNRFYGSETPRFEPRRDSGNTMVELSDDYAMRHIVDRIAYDVDAIQAALLQRREPIIQVRPNQGEVEVTLSLTDTLGSDALHLAKANGLLGNDPISVLTYFSDSISTRVIPYATVAFLTVPLSSRLSPRDLLAIPHEVGHYIYWNGRKGKGYLVDYLRRRLNEAVMPSDQGAGDWVLDWVEELFADTYGCLVSGAVMVLDFQDLLLQFAKDDFELASENEDHPTPILRPFIYTHILRKISLPGVDGQHLLHLADKLDQRWWEKLEERGYVGIPAKALPTGTEGGGNHPLTVAHGTPDPISQLGSPLTMIVDEILLLFKNKTDRTWPIPPTNRRLGKDYARISGDDEALPNLYATFEEYLKEVPETIPAENGITVERLSHLKKRPDKDWLEALKARNWAKKGPHSLM